MDARLRSFEGDDARHLLGARQAGLVCLRQSIRRTAYCSVEKAVNANLNQAFLEAEQRLMTRFGEITLSQLSADVQSLAKQRRDALDVEKIHGGSA